MNGDPQFPSLTPVDIDAIFPEEFYGTDRVVNPFPRYGYAAMAQHAAKGMVPVLDTPGLQQAMEGVERFRRETLDDWMDKNGIDLLAFPANSDVAPSDADVSLRGSLEAWKPGSVCSQGGRAMRALGIPAVQVSIGTMSDISMPVGMTFAGRAYSDSILLQAAYAYERGTDHQHEPRRACVSASEGMMAPDASSAGEAVGTADGAAVEVDVLEYEDELLEFRLRSTCAQDIVSVQITVDGTPLLLPDDALTREKITLFRASAGLRDTVHPAKAGLLIVGAILADGSRLGAFAEFDEPSLEFVPTTG